MNKHICTDTDQEEDTENALQWQRKSVIGFDNTNRKIIDDVDDLGGDGSAYGITNMTCIDGTTSDPNFLTAAQIVLDGASIDGASSPVQDITVNKYFGVIVHELGHFLGLTHSSGNQALSQAIKEEVLDDDVYSRFIPTLASGSFGFYEDQLTLNPDDIAAIQALYPLPSSPVSTVSGTITDASGQPFRGANLELRNIDDPLCEVFSFVSGKECTPLKISENGSTFYGGSVCGSESPNTGDFIFRAIPPGRYILEVSEVLDEYKGGVIHPFPNDDRAISELPGEAEFYNENDQAAEDPYAYSIIEVGPDTHVSGITVTLSNAVPDGDGIENVIPYTYYLDNPDFGDSLENPNTRCQPNTTDYAAAIGVEELVGTGTTAPPPETPDSSSSSSGGGCSLSAPF